MGNENAKEIEQAQPDGTVHGKCENGGVNGISLTITANGYSVDVPTKTSTEKNEEPPSPEEAKTEPTEYVVLESKTEPAKADVKVATEALVSTPDLSVPSEEVPSREEKVEEKFSLFSKMFKKKTAPTTEKDKHDEMDGEDAENEQHLPNGKIHEKQGNDAKNGMGADDPGIQAPPPVVMEPSVQTEPTEYAVLESQTGPTGAEALTPTPDPSVPSEEVPTREEKFSLFSKMFKKKTASPTEKEEETPKEEETGMSVDTDQQKEKGENPKEQTSDICNSPELPKPEEVKTESTEYVVLESQTGAAETEALVPTTEPSSEVVSPREEKVSLFSKMFKKKTAPAPTTEKKTGSTREEDKEPEEITVEKIEEGPSAASQHQDPGCVDSELEKVVEEEEEPVDQSQVDIGSENIDEDKKDSPEEENPVMNFFKTLVTPTKTPKKEAPASDASKDQPQPSETQPAAATTTTTVAQVSDPPAAPKGMPAPPPPPPEPPRAEPAAKKPEEAKAAAKDSPKAKSARDTLTRLFRSKSMRKDSHPSVEEAQTAPDQEEAEEKPQPVSNQTDSVDSQQTVEVTEPVVPVVIKEQEKADASKASTLEAAAKPAPAPTAAQDQKKPEAKKSLLSFLKPKASEAKAAAPAPAAAEPGPAKEDSPKAKSPEAPAETKTPPAAPPGGEEAASAPKKLEKRNSITLFFKNLSQKRPSTDAGAPPEAEKTK